MQSQYYEGSELTVTVIQGSNLERKDFFSKSDPYVILDCNGQRIETRVIDNNQDPIWNESFSFLISSVHSDVISFTIMDKDTITADDFMGQTIVPVSSLLNLQAQELNLPLHAENKPQEPVRGQLRILCEWTNLHQAHIQSFGFKFAPRPHLATSRSVFVPTHPSEAQNLAMNAWDIDNAPLLHFSILEGKNLPAMDLDGSSDPYAVIELGDEKTKTSTINSTLNPYWNYSYFFSQAPNPNAHVIIKVYDHDTFGSDDFIGQAAVPMSFFKRTPSECWLNLEHKGEKRGEVRISGYLQYLSR